MLHQSRGYPYFVFSVSFYLDGIAFAEDVTIIPIEGVLITSGKGDEKIKSPWGELDKKMLLLNNFHRLDVSGKKMGLEYGLFHLDTKSAWQIGNDLTFSSLYVFKSPVSVKLFQEKGSGKWCATDGIIGQDNDKPVVFEGQKIFVVGGADNPIKIVGTAFSDTIIIKDGKPIKSE